MQTCANTPQKDQSRNLTFAFGSGLGKCRDTISSVNTLLQDTISVPLTDTKQKITDQLKELVRKETIQTMKSILLRWQYIPMEDKRWLVANLMTTAEDIYVRIWKRVSEIDERARRRERVEKRMLRDYKLQRVAGTM